MTMQETTPRDPAVDALLTAETLFGQFHALVPRLSSAMPADVSTALGEAQHLYPELWASLDRARQHLHARGVDIAAYDEIRARQPVAMLGAQIHTRERSELADAASMAAFLFGGVGIIASAAIDVAASVGAKQGHANSSGLRDSRAAIDALRNAMPHVDWKALRGHEARETNVALSALSRARTKKLMIGAAGLAVVVGLGVGLVTVLQHSSPEAVAAREKTKKDEKFRADQDEITELNAVLKETPCDATAAERRVTLFQENQQARMARKLAKDFLAKCGDSAKLRAVAER